MLALVLNRQGRTATRQWLVYHQQVEHGRERACEKRCGAQCPRAMKKARNTA